MENPLQKLKNGPLYSGHPKLSEMSKTFIFVEIAFLFVLFTMIVKNVVPLFSFSSIYFYFCLKK